MRRVPLRNIYYLLSYAWNQLEEREILDVRTDDCPDLINLFARVLGSGTSRVLRRGVDQGYVRRKEARRRPRGRIDFGQSARSRVQRPHALMCEYDELDHNVLHNRILRSTLRTLIAAPLVETELRSELRSLHRRLDPIEEIAIRPELFRRLSLDRNTAIYRFLMNVCEMIHDGLGVDPDAGALRFRDFDRDEDRMARVFQSFVRNWATRHLRSTHVGARRYYWRPADALPEDLAYLPRLDTDITLHSPRKVMVIDTKYYMEPFQHFHGTPKLRSEHLYQLMSYLTNAANEEETADVEGLLLYPTADADFTFEYRIWGYRVRAASIDLRGTWADIEDRMRTLLR